jgi:hypothetical protein
VVPSSDAREEVLEADAKISVLTGTRNVNVCPESRFASPQPKLVLRTAGAPLYDCLLGSGVIAPPYLRCTPGSRFLYKKQAGPTEPRDRTPLATFFDQFTDNQFAGGNLQLVTEIAIGQRVRDLQSAKN